MTHNFDGGERSQPFPVKEDEEREGKEVSGRKGRREAAKRARTKGRNQGEI